MRKSAFTLIELLVAVAIIALLAGILLPALSGARAEGRRAVCVSNLHQLGLAMTMYLDGYKDCFWRELVKVTKDGVYDGDLWWFGFEKGGPPADASIAPNRKLDKKRGPLVPFLKSVDNGLQCPAFPYDSGNYWPKFEARSASYGYNNKLGPRNTAKPVHRASQHARETTTMFVFADAVLYDFDTDTRINEGFYLAKVEEAMVPYLASGYGHFRHSQKANVLYLDSHVEPQPLRGQTYSGIQVGGPAGRLTDPAGGNSIFGIDIK